MHDPQAVRTARAIMREKLLDLLERTELSEMARFAAASTGTAALTSVLAFPHEVGGLLLDAAAWQNWAVPKAALSAAVCFNFRFLASAFV